MNKIPIGIPRILVIEEDPIQLSRIHQLMENEAPLEFKLIGAASSIREGLALQEAVAADILFLSLPVQEYSDLEAFRIIQATFPETPVVVLVESNKEDLARHAVQNGAQEYLVKESMDGFLLNRAGKHAFERSRYQAAFAQERAYLGTLLDNIPDRIYFKDEQSRFIRINRALTDLFGLKRPEDAYGKTDADFYGGHHSGDTYADEQRVMLTGEAIVDKIEHETLQSGRQTVSLTTKLPLRDRRGKIVGTCGISREITALKEMERALETERNLLRVLIDQLPDHIFLKDTNGRYVLDNVAHQRWLGAQSASEIEGKTSFDFFNRDQALKHQA
ncbi:MAG: PAS domain-containing protein, partial [Verrucomicrobiota bacterium]